MEMPAVQRTVVVGDGDPAGMHLRPAELFSKLAMTFEAEIEVIRDSLRVDGKSIMHMLTLGAEPGTTLVLEARGADAERAVEALANFIENDFEHDESISQE